MIIAIVVKLVYVSNNTLRLALENWPERVVGRVGRWSRQVA